MRQVALYTRVSTDRQTTENQERELRTIATLAVKLAPFNGGAAPLGRRHARLINQAVEASLQFPENRKMIFQLR